MRLLKKGFISPYFNTRLEIIEKHYDLINVCKPCFIKMRKCNEIEELSAIDTVGINTVIVFENDDYTEIISYINENMEEDDE